MSNIRNLAPQRKDDDAARDWFWRVIDVSRGIDETPVEVNQLVRPRTALDLLPTSSWWI